MGHLNKTLNRLLPIICLGVLGNLAYAWFTTDRNELVAAHFSFGWMLVAMLLALLPWGWHALRLAIWGRFFGLSIAWKQLLRIAMATDVGGVVMPAAVGGAPLKASMLVQQGYRPGQAATLTLWGSIEDVFFYAFAIPVSLSLTRGWSNPLWSTVLRFLEAYRMQVMLGFLIFALLAWLFFNYTNGKTSGNKGKDKLALILAETRKAFSIILISGRKPFLLSLLAITAQWLTRFCILLAVVCMLGLEADWTKLYLQQWMVFVAMMLTPTPGAVGGAEASFLLVFSGSLPEEAVGIVMLSWRFLTYYFMLGTGAFLLWTTQRK